MSDARETEFAKIYEELILASRDFDAAKRETDRTRSLETQSMNRLNDAMKAFDAAVASARKSAPWGSDWHAQQNRGGSVDARA